jgi:hypothetical protein
MQRPLTSSTYQPTVNLFSTSLHCFELQLVVTICRVKLSALLNNGLGFIDWYSVQANFSSKSSSAEEASRHYSPFHLIFRRFLICCFIQNFVWADQDKFHYLNAKIDNLAMHLVQQRWRTQQMRYVANAEQRTTGPERKLRFGRPAILMPLQYRPTTSAAKACSADNESSSPQTSLKYRGQSHSYFNGAALLTG